jgi:hypothetical protein
MSVTNINPQQYIGDTLPIINGNFNNLYSSLQFLETAAAALSAAFSTRIVGITSIDNCGPYGAFFTETYPATISQSSLAIDTLYGTNPIIRNLNTVNYNVDINGQATTNNNTSYYKLNNSKIFIPKGIYDINAGCSGYYCFAHTANIMYTTASITTPLPLLYGSSEYSSTGDSFGSSNNVKIRGRVVFNQDTTVFIKHYFAQKGYVGVSPNTTPPTNFDKFYLAYLGIQKIKSI